jgi:LacI family transcriptional regulator
MDGARITLLDIAREAGVSKNTVSLALRESPRLPRATRKRIQALAARLGYQANPTVAHLMAELRRSRAVAFQASLAMVNANLDPHAFRQHPTVPSYVLGCRRRAETLGYRFDEFWLHDPALDGRRLRKILLARNIRGVIVVGLMNENRLPKRFQTIWESFPCVVTGVRTRQPALSFACVDHHMLVLQAFERLRLLGYRRPGLVLDPVIDHLVEGRFSSGYFIAQQAVSAADRIKPFYELARARQNLAVFRQWLQADKPDVILTLYNEAADWLKKLGLKIPKDVGVVQMEWRPGAPDWAGMNQHNDVVGEAAVEMLVSMIHRNEAGVPAFPRATLIDSSWVKGRTVRRP